MFAAGNIIIDPKCTNLLKAIDEWQHGQHEPDILAATRYGIDSLIRSGKLLPPMRPTHNTYQSLSARWETEKKETAKIKALLDNPRRDLRFRIY
jgi:hypothetical protein